ncbi:60S ribosomal protein L30 [Trifolium repens]|nr:60S ribosomal protein L30 [Trifolium repens]
MRYRTLSHYLSQVPPSLSPTISIRSLSRFLHRSHSPSLILNRPSLFITLSVPINLNRKFLSESKTTQESINNNLALVMKSGKYTLGYKTVLKSLRSSKGIA